MKILAMPLAIAALSAAVLSAQEMPMPNKDSHSVNVVLPSPLPATDANIAKLKLPAGFHLTKYAEGLKSPRVIVVSDAGNL